MSHVTQGLLWLLFLCSLRTKSYETYCWIIRNWQDWFVFGVCVRSSTVKASSVWISWETREQINDVMLKTLMSCAKSLHRYVRHTRSGQSHDLTSVILAFRTWGLHSPLSRYRLQSTLHRKPICLCVSTHERGRNLTR